MQVWHLLLFLIVLLVVTPFPFHLDILALEQLNVFIDRQVHRHSINGIPTCALNGVFGSTLLEVIVPMMLRGRQMPVIPGDIETLMTSNLPADSQNKLED